MSYKISQKIREDAFSKQLESAHREALQTLDEGMEILNDFIILIMEKYYVENEDLGLYLLETLGKNQTINEDDQHLCVQTEDYLLFSTYRQLTAARKLLELGYLESMSACIRVIIESLYVSTICRYSPLQLRNFLKANK